MVILYRAHLLVVRRALPGPPTCSISESPSVATTPTPRKTHSAAVSGPRGTPEAASQPRPNRMSQEQT